ncbi:hypothetical protein LTR09_002957 [Extremus antarcticus]|uniref:Uncharacterized protein n=1 Tax=Extremus antarcticus TaxID=702011 RepID=A0AAJ0LV94_9PEZI|nr:hypothetical protein LTR09_002957 [Extremus antarcticus]
MGIPNDITRPRSSTIAPGSIKKILNIMVTDTTNMTNEELAGHAKRLAAKTQELTDIAAEKTKNTDGSELSEHAQRLLAEAQELAGLTKGLAMVNTAVAMYEKEGRIADEGVTVALLKRIVDAQAAGESLEEKDIEKVAANVVPLPEVEHDAWFRKMKDDAEKRGSLNSS